MEWKLESISHGLRNRFIKNMGIPMQVLKDPYFDYYLSLYDGQYDTRAKWNEFLESLKLFEDEAEFYAKEAQFKNELLAHISGKPEYDGFIKMNMSVYDCLINMNKKNLYSTPNVGKTFTSIDLVKANYQALRYVNSQMVDNTLTYEEFAGQFTNVPHFLKSREIRQFVFGNLSPNRQQTVQKHMMTRIQRNLVNNGLDKDLIMSSSSDEVIIEGDYVTLILQSIPENIQVKVEKFKLEKLGTEKFSFFVKHIDMDGNGKGKEKIKGVNSAYIPEVLKFQMGLPTVEADKLFYNDGRLCSFQDSLFY